MKLRAIEESRKCIFHDPLNKATRHLPFSLINRLSTSDWKRPNIRINVSSRYFAEDTFSVRPPLHLNFALSRRIESCRELIPRHKITTFLLCWNENKIGGRERTIPISTFHYLRISYQTINRCAQDARCSLHYFFFN